MAQQNFKFERVQTVNINSTTEPEESKDDILKARFTPTDADKIKEFCRGRRITVSDYIRDLAGLDTSYFDFIHRLNSNKDMLLPLIRKLT